MSKSNEPQEGLSQLREILVGGVQRNLERRVARAETQTAARVSELQQETRRRTDVIEAHLKRESEALSSRVEREVVESKEGLRGLMREHREAMSALEQRLAKIEESLGRVQHELREQILEQAKDFLDEVQSVRADLTDRITRELDSFELAPDGELSEEPGAREEREDERVAQH